MFIIDMKLLVNLSNRRHRWRIEAQFHCQCSNWWMSIFIWTYFLHSRYDYKASDQSASGEKGLLSGSQRPCCDGTNVEGGKSCWTFLILYTNRTNSNKIRLYWSPEGKLSRTRNSVKRQETDQHDMSWASCRKLCTYICAGLKSVVVPLCRPTEAELWLVQSRRSAQTLLSVLEKPEPLQQKREEEKVRKDNRPTGRRHLRELNMSMYKCDAELLK